jgi:hypothetical protein
MTLGCGIEAAPKRSEGTAYEPEPLFIIVLKPTAPQK